MISGKQCRNVDRDLRNLFNVVGTPVIPTGGI